MSLEQRATFFRERFGLKSFTARTLLSYYRRLGVTFAKPQMIYKAKAREERDLCSE
jgi:hypothetical protein